MVSGGDREPDVAVEPFRAAGEQDRPGLQWFRREEEAIIGISGDLRRLVSVSQDRENLRVPGILSPVSSSLVRPVVGYCCTRAAVGSASYLKKKHGKIFFFSFCRTNPNPHTVNADRSVVEAVTCQEEDTNRTGG